MGYEINKERLHASVLPQTAPFQRCVNVHCTGAECLSSARGNTQSSRKARCRGSAPHRPREWLLQSLFLMPKKDGGLHPILDLRPLNCVLSKRLFKMITLRQILSHIRPGDWFISVDLKDAYFHIQVAPPPQALSEICIRGDSVPIHGPALRLMSGPSYVYEMHGRCSFASEAERNAHPELSRQLASLSPIRECTAQRQVQTPRSYSELRADCKYAKEHAGTKPEHLLLGMRARMSICEHVCQRSAHKNGSAPSQSSN